jgi:hypothetical protein
MVYPVYPDTFWSFKHALKFVSKKASFPPLGLLTVAAMLPKEWNKKLIDTIVRDLVVGEERIYYWKLFLWSLFCKPRLFSLAILYTIYGFHFRRISTSL